MNLWSFRIAAHTGRTGWNPVYTVVTIAEYLLHERPRTEQTR
jgi:hypothetical protein